MWEEGVLTDRRAKGANVSAGSRRRQGGYRPGHRSGPAVRTGAGSGDSDERSHRRPGSLPGPCLRDPLECADGGIDNFPRKPDITLVERPTAANPLGVKGSGQAGCISAPQTIMAAVLDALRPAGVDALDMPATPERIWQALRQASA